MCSDAATWTLFLDLPWYLCSAQCGRHHSAPARKSHLRLHMTNEKVQGDPERDTGRMEVDRVTAGETPCILSFIQGAFHFFLLDVLRSLCRKHTHTHTHTHTLPNFLCHGLHQLSRKTVQGSLKMTLHPRLALQVDKCVLSLQCRVIVRFWKEMAA